MNPKAYFGVTLVVSGLCAAAACGGDDADSKGADGGSGGSVGGMGASAGAGGTGGSSTDGSSGDSAVGGAAGSVSGDEPSYQSGDVSLFYDGYESYASTADLTTGAGDHQYLTASSGLTGISIVSASPGAGAKNLLLDYQAASEYSHILESWNVDDTSSNQVVLTYLFRNTGQWYEGKHWIGFIDGSAGRLLLHTASEPILSPNGLEDCFYDANEQPLRAGVPPRWEVAFVWNRDPLDYHYKQNLNWPAHTLTASINDGAWHRVTTRFTKEGSVEGTGRVEMWFDGLKILEYVGDDASRCEYGKVRTTTGDLFDGFQFPGPSSFQWQGGADTEYDEMRIFSEG